MTDINYSPPKTPEVAPVTVREAVLQAQRYFADTGAFRGDDFVKIFGDPMAGVVTQLTATFPCVNRKHAGSVE